MSYVKYFVEVYYYSVTRLGCRCLHQTGPFPLFLSQTHTQWLHPR